MPRLLLHDPDELDPLRRRYVEILLHAATSGEPPAPSPMHAGLVLCDVLAGREPRTSRFPSAREIRDSAAGKRAEPDWHLAMNTYATATAAALSDQGGFAGAKPALDALQGEADVLDLGVLWGFGLPANGGAGLCWLAWDSLAIILMAQLLDEPRDVRFTTPEQIFERLAGHQQDNGSFFVRGRRDNPELHWYHELVLLHALTSYALISNESFAIDSVKRAALFHHRETQPDHATNQPWAIHAFLLDPETIPTADLMLLAAGISRPEGLDAVSRILLADAAVCLMAKPSA